MNPVYSPGSSGVPFANAKGIGYPAGFPMGYAAAAPAYSPNIYPAANPTFQTGIYTTDNSLQSTRMYPVSSMAGAPQMQCLFLSGTS